MSQATRILLLAAAIVALSAFAATVIGSGAAM
jgi:hypothetical protein